MDAIVDLTADSDAEEDAPPAPPPRKRDQIDLTGIDSSDDEAPLARRPRPAQTARPEPARNPDRDLLARSDDDDSVPEIPGTTI